MAATSARTPLIEVFIFGSFRCSSSYTIDRSPAHQRLLKATRFLCVLHELLLGSQKAALLFVEVRGNLSVHRLALFDEFIQDGHDRVDTLFSRSAVHLSEELVDLGVLSFLFFHYLGVNRHYLAMFLLVYALHSAWRLCQ